LLALFLGAGFSAWAASLPVARQLFSFDLEPFGPREEKRLALVKALKASWDSAHPNCDSEQFVAAALDFPKNGKEAVLWYLGRVLSEPFVWEEIHFGRVRRHTLMIDEYRKFQFSGVLKAQKFLQTFLSPALTGIVTTNYDLVIEYALGTRTFNYGNPYERLLGRGPYPVSQWRSPVILKGNMPLAKLHGSISWDEHDRYTDGRRGLTGRALIVPPTPEKQTPDALRPVWQAAERILRHAKKLLVFGFAFNPYDEATINLLREAGCKLESVLLIDPVPQIQRASDIWPRSKIMACSSPPHDRGAINYWRLA